MTILVIGSRSWDPSCARGEITWRGLARARARELAEQKIRDRLSELPRGTTVISGGARGADQMAAGIADELGFRVIVMKAFWTVGGIYNPKAGFQRNLRMLDQAPELVIAFWDGESTGTLHTLVEAQKRGIPYEIIRPREQTCDVRWGQEAMF